jgi:hypothetical protein
MKARAGALQARLAEVLQLVKLKSPSVLLQLQRAGSSGGTPSKALAGSLSPAASMSPHSTIKSSGGPSPGGKAFY